MCEKRTTGIYVITYIYITSIYCIVLMYLHQYTGYAGYQDFWGSLSKQASTTKYIQVLPYIPQIPTWLNQWPLQSMEASLHENLCQASEIKKSSKRARQPWIFKYSFKREKKKKSKFYVWSLSLWCNQQCLSLPLEMPLRLICCFFSIKNKIK